MDIEKLWEQALKKTEIQRARLNKLHTFKATELPYTLLTESSVNIGDTVVRKGTIKVNKPLIIMPHQYPVFEGFNFEEDIHVGDDMLRSFLLMRGISLPSLRYSNRTYSVDLHEDSLKKAIKHYKNILQKKEDIRQGLIIGADDAWKFSLLIYVAAMVSKSASSDVQAFLDKLREEGFRNN